MVYSFGNVSLFREVEEWLDMALAYTPGLKVKAKYIMKKVRMLPVSGKILVSEMDRVLPDTIVATTSVPGEPTMIDICKELNIDPLDLSRAMIMHEGDHVYEGKALAQTSFFGFFRKEYPSPCTGTLEKVSDITGQVTIRKDPDQVEVKAYIPGVVTKVFPSNGVLVETPAAFIQGIFGIGGETHGEVKVVAERDEVLTDKQITTECAGKVVVGGALVTEDALRRAVEVGVKGIVVGGIRGGDLSSFLGYEIGVAITGSEDARLTLIVLEGFGRMSISDGTYKLLKRFEGRLACINGATQIRAGVIRPEIIIPLEDVDQDHVSEGEEVFSKGMEPGMRLRIIRQPHFGALGRIASLPSELQKMETESEVRVLEIELDSGERVILPRANVELIEE